jgi:hypothetical protein
MTVALRPGRATTPRLRGPPDAAYAAAPTAPTPTAPTPTPTAARRTWRRWTLRLTPATLVAVRGRPTAASAVSKENNVSFAGDQLNEAGTAAQTRAVLTETANRLSFFMIVSRLIASLIDHGTCSLQS